MKLHRTLASVSLSASACAIGMFDGVHLGHRMVLENALREAKIRGVESVVVSFANHPQSLVSQTPTQLLSTLDERLAIFEALGFDHALILDFDEWLMNLPAQEFVSRILVQHLHVQSVSVGYDHRFGKGRQGNGDMLKQLGQRYGFVTQIIEPVRVKGQIISSTLIRKLLSYGDIKQANVLLGRPYALAGQVVQGVQRGRTLGFPTANLSIEPARLIPGVGTYGGYAELQGKEYPALCNIGLSPTFGDQTQKRVEVHLLEYQGGEFYEEPLAMHFVDKIRDEKKFASAEELIQQIQDDCAYFQSTLLPTYFHHE